MSTDDLPREFTRLCIVPNSIAEVVLEFAVLWDSPFEHLRVEGLIDVQLTLLFIWGRWRPFGQLDKIFTDIS